MPRSTLFAGRVHDVVADDVKAGRIRRINDGLRRTSVAAVSDARVIGVGTGGRRPTVATTSAHDK